MVTVGDVVAGHLREQVDELLACAPEARAGDPEGIHRMRVAARRLRSALATFRPVLDDGAADLLGEELRWLGSALAAARDAQVQHRRLVDLAASLADGRVPAAARQRLDAELQGRCAAAGEDLAAALGSERYRRLVAGLRTLAADPPLSGDASRPAYRGLPVFVRHAARRVERRAAAGEAAASAERATRLHEVRKAAKRARYAAEVAAPVVGKPARRVAKGYRRVQDVLGEHQDSATARALLRDLRRGAAESEELAAALDLLQDAERRHGRAARRAYPEALRGAARAARRLHRRRGRT